MLRSWFKRIALASAFAVLFMLGFASAAYAQSGGGIAQPSTGTITGDLASWAALVGIGLPAVVALLQRDHFGSTWNAVLFGIAVVVASVVYAYIKYSNDFTWAHWEASLLTIVVWGIATYKLYWKPSGITSKARAVPIGIGPAAGSGNTDK